MNKPSVAVIVEITIDADNDTYRTKSYLEVAEEYTKTNKELPRDVMLAMVYELEVILNKITKKADIKDEEIAEYIAERQLVSNEDGDDNIKPIGKKDDIDSSIDRLFEDDD